MPNWCENDLTIEGPVDDLRKFKEAAIGKGAKYKVDMNLPPEFRSTDEPPESMLSFHALCPVPPKVLAETFNDVGYDWQVNNWGTKWQPDIAEFEDNIDLDPPSLIYRFLTAWSPPEEIFKTIAPNWPTLTFTLEYREEGMDFEGVLQLNGDKVLQDNCGSCDR